MSGVRPWRRAPLESPGKIPAGGGDGYHNPEEAQSLSRPMRRWCRHCRTREVDREGIVCTICRADFEQEAVWNGLDPWLDDQVLRDTLKAIAGIESKAALHRWVADREERRGALRLASLHRARALLWGLERRAVIEGVCS